MEPFFAMYTISHMPVEDLDLDVIEGSIVSERRMT